MAIERYGNRWNDLAETWAFDPVEIGQYVAYADHVAVVARLTGCLERALHLSGGWREAVVELEDFCSERVRLRNMMAAADQIDEWRVEARAVLAADKSQ